MSLIQETFLLFLCGVFYINFILRRSYTALVRNHAFGIVLKKHSIHEAATCHLQWGEIRSGLHVNHQPKIRVLILLQGILFLTTNRVGTLDPAFKSRIHLSLLYPRLSRNSTVKIWKNHLKRLREQIKEGGKSLEIDRRDILVFARSHFDSLSKQDKAPWNGRQIRNAFQTAVALADFQSEARSTPKLNHTQFKKVAETSMEFDRYLEAMYGGRDDALVAERDQTRLDRFATESLRPSATPATTVYRQTAPSMPSMGVNRPTTTTTTGRRGPAVKQQQQQATPPEEAAGLSPHPSDDDDEDDDQEDMEADD